MIKELSILLILVLFVSLVGETLNTFLVENTVAGVATTWECRKYVKSNDQLFIKIEKENNEESTFWLDFDHGFCSDRVVEGNVGDNLIINYASIGPLDRIELIRTSALFPNLIDSTDVNKNISEKHWIHKKVFFST